MARSLAVICWAALHLNVKTSAVLSQVSLPPWGTAGCQHCSLGSEDQALLLGLQPSQSVEHALDVWCHLEKGKCFKQQALKCVQRWSFPQLAITNYLPLQSIPWIFVQKSPHWCLCQQIYQTFILCGMGPSLNQGAGGISGGPYPMGSERSTQCWEPDTGISAAPGL